MSLAARAECEPLTEAARCAGEKKEMEKKSKELEERETRPRWMLPPLQIRKGGKGGFDQLAAEVRCS